MFVGTSVDSSPNLANPAHHLSPDCPSKSPSPTFPPPSPPCWVTQALNDLAQAEADLHQLQERQATATELVKRGVDRAILGARREEQRLLERVEQDHRDAQQRLEQVKRENIAAVRVSQSLLEQRLRKLAQLQKKIQEVDQQSGLNQSCPNQNLLLKEISEFLQPWEISLALKKVNFKPSSQPNAVTFGDIRVEDQSLCLHVGGCGPQGQMCPLHSQEMQCEDTNHQGPGGEGVTSPTGRVARKITLSPRSDLESEEKGKIGEWPTNCSQSEWQSSQDGHVESFLQQQGDDVFLAVPTVNVDNESRQHTNKMNSDGKYCSPRIQRSLSVLSGRRLSPSPERRQEHGKMDQCLSSESQGNDKSKVSLESSTKNTRYGNSVLSSPKITPRETLTSHSCLDLTARGGSHSRLSQSSDEHSLGTLGDSGRAPSPTDSLDSSYTFIVSPSNDCSMNKGSFNYSCRLSKSAVDLTHKTRPLISSGGSEQFGTWRMKCNNSQSNTNSVPPNFNRNPRVSEIGQTLSYPSGKGYNNLPQQQNTIRMAGSRQPLGCRSLSMSVIDGFSQEPKKNRGDRGEPALVETEEEGEPSFVSCNTSGPHLIKQFGKQGSGRADLTLPSGIHATPQGQLFIVDCGNARIQVTDPRGNVLQQVSTSTSNGSARRCRNYFDIAVNAKGLIALSCAAERALLVFSRHGRLLQTFGGSGRSSAKDELEAPRGVTVTRMDEFLVADIRKGTLIAYKLEPKTGCRVERTVVTGFHRPYLVAACLSSGMMAVSERGNETGRVPCIKVLEPGWNTVRILGVCAGMGPVLVCPWGICLDPDGNVFVADWGEEHKVLLYPSRGTGWVIINQGLSSPRGLALLPEGQLAVSDSMHHCIKIYQYKASQD